jgi:hypothetical protein
LARRDEVEEFLRRAAARRAQAAAKGRPAAPQSQQPFAPPPPPRRPPPELIPIEAEVVDAELADTNRVSSLVDRDLAGTQEIAEHTRRLGAEVDLADDKLEAHLQQVFDHRVGQLKTRAGDSVPQTLAGPSAGAPGLSSSDLARLLMSPQQIRNAIVLGEILRRPEERW